MIATCGSKEGNSEQICTDDEYVQFFGAQVVTPVRFQENNSRINMTCGVLL